MGQTSVGTADGRGHAPLNRRKRRFFWSREARFVQLNNLHWLIIPHRVSTPLPYYLSELLYVPVASLQNTRTVPLHVVTIGACAYCDGAQSLPVFLKGGAIGVASNDNPDHTPSSKRVKVSPASDGGTPIKSPLTDLTHSVNPVCLLKCTDITVSKCAVAILKAALKDCAAWWLDIDLDFFSTANPFKSVFTKVWRHVPLVPA